MWCYAAMKPAWGAWGDPTPIRHQSDTLAAYQPLPFRHRTAIDPTPLVESSRARFAGSTGADYSAIMRTKLSAVGRLDGLLGTRAEVDAACLGGDHGESIAREHSPGSEQ